MIIFQIESWGSPFMMEEEEEMSKEGQRFRGILCQGKTERSSSRRESSVGSNFAERIRKLGTEKRLDSTEKKKKRRTFCTVLIKLWRWKPVSMR